MQAFLRELTYRNMKKQSLLLALLVLLAATAAQAQPLCFLTYNIRYDNPADGADAWPLRRDFLVAQLRFHAPDVFGIQEGLQRQVEYIETQLPAYARVGVGRDDGREAGEYSALFYRKERFKALDSGTFWLSETPDSVSKGWDAALPRICTWALLEESASGRKFWVFNTHFDHVGALARENSAKLILQKIKTFNSANYPVALLGDLNSEPGSAPVALLQNALSDTHDHCQEPPFGPEGTFNGFRFQEPVTRRIDYIFVSGAWKTRKYAVLSDSRNCHYPSDHLPVLVRVE